MALYKNFRHVVQRDEITGMKPNGVYSVYYKDGDNIQHWGIVTTDCEGYVQHTWNIFEPFAWSTGYHSLSDVRFHIFPATELEIQFADMFCDTRELRSKLLHRDEELYDLHHSRLHKVAEWLRGIFRTYKTAD